MKKLVASLMIFTFMVSFTPKIFSQTSASAPVAAKSSSVTDTQSIEAILFMGIPNNG